MSKYITQVKSNGKGEQVGNEKVNNESKTDDAGRGGAKMKMRIFDDLSL